MDSRRDAWVNGTSWPCRERSEREWVRGAGREENGEREREDVRVGRETPRARKRTHWIARPRRSDFQDYRHSRHFAPHPSSADDRVILRHIDENKLSFILFLFFPTFLRKLQRHTHQRIMICGIYSSCFSSTENVTMAPSRGYRRKLYIYMARR